MTIQAKDLKIGMEIHTSPEHCMKITSIEVGVYKASGIVKITAVGVTRKFTDSDSKYWETCINTKNIKGNTEIEVNTFPNIPK